MSLWGEGRTLEWEGRGEEAEGRGGCGGEEGCGREGCVGSDGAGGAGWTGARESEGWYGKGGMPSNIRPWGPGTMLKGVEGRDPGPVGFGFWVSCIKII